jgi:hypothetical protein
VDLDALPSCTVAVAAIDGRDLDPENVIYHADTGITTYTHILHQYIKTDKICSKLAIIA